MNKRNFAAAAGVLVAATAMLAPLPAWAAYPDRPVKLVVPYPAGGTTDVVARMVARNMSTALGQEVVVENKSGAATIIGVDSVAKSAPDGYTVLLATATSFAVNPHVYKSLPYKLDEFVPIGFINEAPILLVANASNPAQTLPELISWLKGRETAVATTGKGGFSHLTSAMFFGAINARFRDVPYRGEAPALQDLLGGQVPLYFGSMPGTLPYVKAGKLRAYGVTSVDRSPTAPDIPSFTEQGQAEVVATSWFGLMAPKGTSSDVVSILEKALNKAMQDKELLARMAASGAVPRNFTATQFADYVERDHARWGRIVRAANISAE